MRIVVASTNPVKQEAVRRAFARMFPQEAWEILGVAVPSGVGDQPLSDAETLRGALNRARAARAAHPEAAYWVGIEGGVQPDGEDLLSFAWVAVLDAQGRLGRARSGTFLLPPAVARLVRQGYELGLADDMVFGQTNSKQKMGAVGLLSGGVIDRTALYEHALVLALLPFKHPIFRDAAPSSTMEAP